MSRPTSEAERYRVGYALQSKKVKTLIQPSLVEHAKQRGVDLVPVDLSKPLIQQGFFHCIVHKLHGGGWNEQLKQYASEHPNSVIIDPPERIERLRSRISMLEAVTRLEIPQLGVPKQVLLQDSESVESLGLKLKLPVIAKPVEADGSAASHELYLVSNRKGLKKVKAPIVLQEFVNHGGVVFKGYVVGEHVKCVKRNSLPDIPVAEDDDDDGLVAFSQISNSPTPQSEAEQGNTAVENAEMPSVCFVEAVGRALREELGLHLFNFDLIRDCTRSSGGPVLDHPRNNPDYLVIDINYFPGFAKMPCFEQVLTDFFLKCCSQPTP